MTKYLETMVDIGSHALTEDIPDLAFASWGFADIKTGELAEFLRKKNGFYAFESALHVFSSTSASTEIGIVEWNAHDLWIGEYRGMIEKCLFFAEDIFGGQFCIKSDGIYSFDPETAQFEYLATDLEGWARTIMTEYEVLTGFPLAHAWQKLNGAIKPGMRLIPKIPFVLGGEFKVENLISVESAKAMRLRASLAIQIQNSPDGTSITWDTLNGVDISRLE